ncbi:MAG: DUF547 domain-containing protein [Desulfocapsaceae bacterium]|nr:DUF547 domain-containing protein [Desulfocapsaceae bacterium]
MITKYTAINLRRLIPIFCLALMLGMANEPQAKEELHTIWAELLDKHVNGGVVDYHGFKKDEDQLDAYLDVLDATDPEQLPENKRLALWLNAYNAYTVKLILDNFEEGQPVKSIRDIGGFFSGPWDIKFCRVGGEVYTLDNIEHDIIRPRFQEPRIHFAVNCASQGCPPLISEPYVGAQLDEQLTSSTVNFINDKEFNYLDGSTLYVTKIFKWFSEDFNEGVVSFVRKYAKADLQNRLAELGDNVRVKYLDYDWSLNNK